MPVPLGQAGCVPQDRTRVRGPRAARSRLSAEWRQQLKEEAERGGGGGRSRKDKGKMPAAAGDVVSPPDEEAASQPS
jgi:hypothetical protein